MGDGRMIDRQPTLGHHFLQVAVAERIAQVPTQTKDVNIVMEVPPRNSADRL